MKVNLHFPIFMKEARFVFMLSAIVMAIISYVGFVSCNAWKHTESNKTFIHNIPTSTDMFEKHGYDIVMSCSFGLIIGACTSMFIALCLCSKSYNGPN